VTERIEPYQPRRAPLSEFLDVCGLRLQVTRWGSGGSNCILLLHGFQDSGATFQFLVDSLPDDWSFIAPDLRGFGGSAGQNHSYWFPDYLADVDALLAYYLPTGAQGRVIGHSMGGNIALLHAGVRPERWRWVVSLEGFGLPRTRPFDAPARYVQWLNAVQAGPRPRSRYQDADALSRKLLERNRLLAAERAAFIARAWTRPGPGGGVEIAADPWHRLVNPVLYRREEAEACWQQISAPTLMVLASGSDYLSRLERDDDVVSMQKCIRTLEVARLEGLGHMMHHEDPAAVAAPIIEFVRRHGASTPATARGSP
jgi:pimeloyl-ACP methyl ester carboxylesterase